MLMQNCMAFIILFALTIIHNGIQCFPHPPLSTMVQQQQEQQHYQLQNDNKNYPELLMMGSRLKSHPLQAENDNILDPDAQGLITSLNENNRILSPPHATNSETFGSQSGEDAVYNEDNDEDDNQISGENDTENGFLQSLVNEIQSEEEIAIKSANLLRLLQEMPEGPLPIVYVEDAHKASSFGNNAGEVAKRSGRYYRRYPWKRQNPRYRTSAPNSYEADSKYQCVPSREDVFKLLVGLHENRNGNQHKTVHFCNRKRPAKAIFTNIRFLG